MSSRLITLSPFGVSSCCSATRLHSTLCDPTDAACQVSVFLTTSQSLPRITYLASVMPSSHLILWCPLLLLPSIFPSIRDFSSESAVHIRWPKYWSFSLSISPSNKYSGLISLKIDWFDLLAIQGTLGSLIQHHSFEGINSLVLCLFYGPALTTVCDHWEDHGLTIQTFVSRVISLLFNTLSKYHSFPAKKQLSSDFMTTVTILSDFRAQEEEICPYFHLFPSICHEVMGLDAILVFLIFSFKPFTLHLHPSRD